MNLIINTDILNLLPEFDVIAYKIDFSEDFDAMNKSETVDKLFENIYNEFPKKYNYDEITKIPKLTFKTREEIAQNMNYKHGL